MNPTLYCNKCGAANSAEAQFCSRCGSALNPVSAGLSPAAAAPTPVVAGSYNPVVATVGYGGFWIRVVAFIMDGIIVRAAALPGSIIFGLGGVVGWVGGFSRWGG